MWQVIKNNVRQLMVSKGSLIIMLILPVILFSLGLGLSGGGMSRWDIAFVDEDQTVLSQSLSDMLEKEGNKISILNSQQADEALTSSQVEIAVILPQGFEEAVMQGGTPNIVVRSLKGQEVASAMTASLNLHIGDMLRIKDILGITEPQQLAKEQADLAQKGMQFTEEPLSEGRVNTGLSQASGFLFYVLSMSMLKAGSLILKEKQMGTLNRIRQAPVGRMTYIMAVFCTGLAFLAITLASLWVLTTYVFHTKTTVDMYILWAYYAIVWILMGIFMALTVKSTSAYSNLSTILTVITAMLGGCWWPLWLMPDFMQTIAMVVPQYWALDAMTALQRGKTLLTIPVQVLALTGFAALFLALCIFALRRSKTAEVFI